MTRPLALAAAIAAAAWAQPHLVFDHKIGTDWPPGNQWMNFVALSSDGSTVASNGNIPGSPEPGLGFWKFPGGEYLRRVVAPNPLAASPDFRYLATGAGILDLAATQPPANQPPPPPAYTLAAFDSTGEYVALVVTRSHAKSIVVLKTAD